MGDSIFDNEAYTRGEPDVVTHLTHLLPSGWQATLLAVDGSTCVDVVGQTIEVTGEMTDIVLSIGGNDALMNADVLNLSVSSTREAFLLLGERSVRFEADYRAALKTILGLGRRTACCTIYNGNLGPFEAPVARVALMAFNDAIVRVAFEHELELIDLRLVCTTPADYANPIEPSGEGGRKIARAIADTLVGKNSRLD
jgi:hypothetical protein